MLNKLPPELITALGLNSHPTITHVFGGDINRSYRIESAKQKFFLKINASSLPRLFETERNGLMKLNGTGSIRVPKVIYHFQDGDSQYLVLEWLEKQAPSASFWENFGRSLALLHKNTFKQFGLEEDNYIGSLPQENTFENSWSEFYYQRRILPLMMICRQRNIFSEAEVKRYARLETTFSEIFPAEAPALLHGDLWSGNYMIADQGEAAIFDPAVYYGHREMDLGMSKLFGGFDKRFYDAYQEQFPLEGDWLSRTELTQLYPLLVHLVLFGGHYHGEVVRILKRYG